MRNLGFIAALIVFVPSAVFAQAPASPTTTASGPLSLPSAPEVSDPMLAPPPSPKRVLATWEEGVATLRARSTDLKIALDQVLQAEAQTRIALAQYLPSINANNAGGGTYQHQLITRSVGGGLSTTAAGGLTQTSRVPVPHV